MAAILAALRGMLLPGDLRALGGVLTLLVLGGMVEAIGVGAIPLVLGALLAPGAGREVLAWLPLGNLLPSWPWPWVLAGVGLFFLFRTGFGLAVGQVMHVVVRRRQLALGGRLFSLYLAAPLSFHAARNSAELLRRLQSDLAYGFGGSIAHLLLLANATLSACFVLLLLAASRPGLTGAVALPLLATGGLVTLWQRRRAARLAPQAETSRTAQTIEIRHALGALREVRVLGLAGWFVARFDAASRRLAEVQRAEMLGIGLPGQAMELAGMLILLATAGVMAWGGAPGEAVVTTVGLYSVGLLRVKASLGSLFASLGALRFRQPALLALARDLRELAGTAVPVASGEVEEKTEGFAMGLELDELRYRHPGAEAETLRGVSLTVPKGALIGLTGVTGAGKSTLIDLVLGLLEPQVGAIRVDGRDIAPRLAAWQRACAYLPQAMFLLDDTVRRNVALGVADEQVDEERLWRALERARAATLVLSLPQGLDARVGEGGARLSGGERQRLCLARALYPERPFLVMDEGTSALDEGTQATVMRGLAAPGGPTVLMVSHRPSTLAWCDAVYRLEDGRAVRQDMTREAR